MKYNILGFSQSKLVENKLDLLDAALLRELLDFYSTGKMVEKVINGNKMFWVRYKSFIEQLPILGINNTDSFKRRMQRLVDAGLMIHATHRQGGTFSFYAFTGKVASLIYSDSPTQGSDPSDSTVAPPPTPQSEQKTLLSRDSSIKHNNPLPPEGFDAFWDAYPRKIGKAAALKAYKQVLNEIPDNILEILALHKRQEQWAKDNGQFIPHASTWLRNKRWEDEIKDVAAKQRFNLLGT